MATNDQTRSQDNKLESLNPVCPVCKAGRFSDSPMRAKAFSNVRHFKTEQFNVWRCSQCGSVHCLEPVDLQKYYKHYPLHLRKLDWFSSVAFNQLVRRLEKCGLNRESQVLDYGCGSGLFIQFLKSKNFKNVSGYDAFSKDYADPSVLQQKYDVIFCLDVVEHAVDPLQMLSELSGYLKPNGLLYVGTPRAEGIDFKNIERHIHTLHLPYHRSIFSEQALVKCGPKFGLVAEAIERRQYVDTIYPFINSHFVNEYLKVLDNTLDAAFEPPPMTMFLLNPKLIFFGLFGYLFNDESEVSVVFRKQR